MFLLLQIIPHCKKKKKKVTLKIETLISNNIIISGYTFFSSAHRTFTETIFWAIKNLNELKRTAIL